MIPLKATIRKDFGKKAKLTRMQDNIPAVVYGPETKNLSIQVDEKEFKKVFQKSGESSLVELLIEKEKKPVLVHETQKDPVSDKIIHIDFFQPSLTEEVEVKIPLVFEGVASAEKDLGGTLVKNISEIEVRALPQNLPHEILVNIESLKTFENHILVKDLKISEGVKVLKKPDEIIISVLPPQKIEEELAVPIEEKVEDVEKIKKPKKEEEFVEEESPKEHKT